jgi:hypothetical protein
MTPEMLINAAGGVTLWLAAAAGVVLLLRRYPAVVRRDLCRLALVGVPVVLVGAVAMHCCNPSAGLLRRVVARPVPTAAPVPAQEPSVQAAAPHAAAPDEAPRPAGAAEAARPSWTPLSEPGELPRPAAAHAPHAGPAAHDHDAPAWTAGLRLDWQAGVMAAMLLGSGAGALLLALRHVRLAMWRRTWRPAPPQWRSVTRRLAERIGPPWAFSVFVAPGLGQPAATGVLRPVIVLPARAPERVGFALRAALAHELGHLRGRDPMWNLLADSVVALAWWCPLSWWLRRRLRIEGEQTADDYALDGGVRPIDLARTLAQFAEWNQQPLPVSVSGMACHLTRRIEMIMSPRQPHDSVLNRRARWLLALAACLAAAAIVCTPVVGIARADQGGERREVRRAEGAEKAQPPREEKGERPAPRRDGDERGEGDEGGRRPRRREGRGGGEGERRGGGEGERRGMPRDLVRMAEELKATDAQKKALQEKVLAKDAAVRAWRRGNEARVREAREALRKAQQALRELREQERKVTAEADQKILAVFTPQQRAKWETLKIARMYDRRNAEGPMPLRPSQVDHMEDLCNEAARKLVAVAGKPPAEAEQAKRQILYDLQKSIYEKVLDPDQQRRSPRPRSRRREGEGEGRERRDRDRPRIPDGEREGGDRDRPRERDADREGGERDRPRAREGDREG